MPVGYHETPVSSGSGISVMLALAEPMLFLEGFDRGDSSSRKTSLLRGYLRIKVAKAAKIKKIYLHFKGTSHTHWPEGTSFRGNVPRTVAWPMDTLYVLTLSIQEFHRESNRL